MDLTDAALRERAREIIAKLRMESVRDDHRHCLDDLLVCVDALRDAARAEQREADALAVCLQCREALQREAPEAEERNGQWVHVHGPHDWRNCNAAAIRSA